MRRLEREITSRDEIDAILLRERILRIAFAMDNEPYVVPLSYGYDRKKGALYLHTARVGRKLEFIARNPRVCFEVEGPTSLRPADKACAWGLDYECVIGYGKVSEVVDPEEKVHALRCLMRQQTGESTTWTFAAKELSGTRAWALSIESVTGKRAA
jgi:nitroimidazol reductase NimA-like FMN-containing flavoprotein (pyridoxamine 5'-phosphate oxidase superfamily)